MRPQHLKAKRQKEVRGIHKRQREIYKEIRDLGYIKLPKPVRHGWFKEIILTENIERYKNKATILELYEKINKCFWGRTKEEANKKWLNQVSRHLIYRDLPTISKKQFNKLSYKAQIMCTAFWFRTESKKLKVRFYVRIPKGVYRIKYSRAYITHSKKIDPALESELDLLQQQLEKNGYYNIWQQNKWKDYWRTSEQKKEKLKMVRQLKDLKKYPLADIINDNIIWEKN